jgi:hypothetical protein
MFSNVGRKIQTLVKVLVWVSVLAYIILGFLFMFSQEVPVYDWVTIINRGWDNFESLEEAEKAYGLTKVEPDEVEDEI